MSWVKRSGGAGTGVFGKGLAAAMNGEGSTERAPRPRARVPEPEATDQLPGGEPATPPAYSADSWPEVRGVRIELEVIASWVREGNEGCTSLYFDGALVALGPDSPHLAAACRGDAEAGSKYQQVAAGGRYRTANGGYWQE